MTLDDYVSTHDEAQPLALFRKALMTTDPIHVATFRKQVGMLNDTRSRKRFQREVELAARLTHPNIVRVYEAGEVARQNYFSMELVDGVPWSQHVRTNRLSKSEVLQQLLQVLDAVAYAHTQGVIHRDLKPSNILVEKTGKIYVVDFGLAKYHASEDDDLSQQGDVIGTLTFMSPEQASGDVSSTDSRSDVYSLGAVVVYLLGNGLTTNKRQPGKSRDRASGETGLQKQAAAILRNDPRLRRILVKALAPRPDQRYENAGAFAADLREYLEVRMTEVVRSSATKPLPGSKWMLGAAGILVLAGITTMIAIGYRPDRDPDAEVTAAQTTSGEEVVDASESEDNLSERDRAIAEKFGNRFAASFQSSGDRPEAVTVTSGVGTRDPADYPVVHPRRWPLVGFNLATYAFRGRLIIKTIQPIFRDPASGATETSQMFGRLHPRCEFHQVLAEPGNYVTGIEGVGGTRLHELRVIFASATPGSASTASHSTADEENLSDRSGSFGDPLDEPTEVLGNTGRPAIGIVCSSETDIHQIGLILDASETGSKLVH